MSYNETTFYPLPVMCDRNFTYISDNNGLDFHLLDDVIKEYSLCDSQVTLRRDEGFPFYLNSFCSPPVILVTLVCNTFVCIVLTRKSMINPTNIILLNMALADLLTAFFPLPFHILTPFVRENHNFYNSAVVTLLFTYTTSVLPTIFHTTNIWLTVVLAIQRTVYLFFPTKAKDICTVASSSVIAATVFLLSSIYHQPLALYNRYIQVIVMCALNKQSKSAALRCPLINQTTFVEYFYSRTVVVNCIPCLLLTIFTVLLIIGLRKTKQRHNVLMNRANGCRQNVINSCMRSQAQNEGKNTTMMLVVILILFLIVEIPMAIILLVYIIQKLSDVHSASKWMAVVSPIWNLVILISYPLNFFVYCRMSTQFRKTFASMFGCNWMNHTNKKSHTTELAKFETKTKRTSIQNNLVYSNLEQNSGEAMVKNMTISVDVYNSTINHHKLQNEPVEESLLLIKIQDNEPSNLEDGVIQNGVIRQGEIDIDGERTTSF